MVGVTEFTSRLTFTLWLLLAEGTPLAVIAIFPEYGVALGSRPVGSAEMVSVVGRAGLSSDESLCILSERHAASLRKGAALLEGALGSLRSGMTNEFVALDLRQAAAVLGDITGEMTSDDVLNSIFDRFCVGK